MRHPGMLESKGLYRTFFSQQFLLTNLEFIEVNE